MVSRLARQELSRFQIEGRDYGGAFASNWKENTTTIKSDNYGTKVEIYWQNASWEFSLHQEGVAGGRVTILQFHEIKIAMLEEKNQ